MNDQIIAQHSKKYLDRGTVLIRKEEKINPISKKDLIKLFDCCNDVEKEFIKIGDAGEDNNLLVGRFMTDVKKPEIVKNPFSETVINILTQNKVNELIKQVIGMKNDCHLRRVQFNQIDRSNFVGYHLDTDSNPDYIAACVLQLGDDYTGGKYRVYQKDGSYIDYVSKFGDLIISNCTYPHEVTKVESGNRKSLVFFISKHSGANKRNN